LHGVPTTWSTPHGSHRYQTKPSVGSPQLDICSKALCFAAERAPPCCSASPLASWRCWSINAPNAAISRTRPMHRTPAMPVPVDNPGLSVCKEERQLSTAVTDCRTPTGPRPHENSNTNPTTNARASRQALRALEAARGLGEDHRPPTVVGDRLYLAPSRDVDRSCGAVRLPPRPVAELQCQADEGGWNKEIGPPVSRMSILCVPPRPLR
jgi:hypothetical protein